MSLVVVCDGEVKAHALAHNVRLVVGRSDRADVTVDDAGLSREHARIEVRNGRCTVEDLGSRNGTFIDGARLPPGTATAVLPETVVVLGCTRLLIQTGAAPAQAGPRSAALMSLRRVAATDLNVLLVGEPGTGKRAAARALHAASRRIARPLEIHEAGAAPLPDAPEGSTLLVVGLERLDALDQVRLADALSRLAGVRLVGTLCRGEEDGAVEQAALFDLLGQVRIHLPPVRMLQSELAAIVEDLVAGVVRELGFVSPPEVGPAVVEAVARGRWPGNLTQLRAALERAVVGGDGRRLNLDALLDAPVDGWTTEEADERQRIVAALSACAGNQTRAARQLRISRGTLVSRLHKYGIKRPRK